MSERAKVNSTLLKFNSETIRQLNEKGKDELV